MPKCNNVETQTWVTIEIEKITKMWEKSNKQEMTMNKILNCFEIGRNDDGSFGMNLTHKKALESVVTEYMNTFDVK